MRRAIFEDVFREWLRGVNRRKNSLMRGGDGFGPTPLEFTERAGVSSVALENLGFTTEIEVALDLNSIEPMRPPLPLDVSYWHFSDVQTALTNVRFRR